MGPSHAPQTGRAAARRRCLVGRGRRFGGSVVPQSPPQHVGIAKPQTTLEVRRGRFVRSYHKGSEWHDAGRFAYGDRIVLASFGAGFTSGAVYLRWAIGA